MAAVAVSATMHVGLRVLALLLAALAVALAVSWRDEDVPVSSEGAEAPREAILEPMPGVTALPPLFRAQNSGTEMPVADGAAGGDGLPQMVGVAGRLPDDIEVLVRLPDGTSTSLRRGQSTSGWVLVSAAVDRAIFERAGLRRVVLIESAD